ncbi:hypothetical protein MCAP1_002717 [Malassezia caprae]|uniref:Uncharacterized protein n=1 Tax=Malassezia caprae TaxID=1381934 RepID=A0AAF0E7G7_9BASI|nr:hypothetical protein MCAP1_002717 [Malassezia caprae]
MLARPTLNDLWPRWTLAKNCKNARPKPRSSPLPAMRSSMMRVRAFSTAALARQSAPPSRHMGKGQRARRSAAELAAPALEAPTPATAWDQPLFREASRRPGVALPRVRLGADVPASELKSAPLTQKETHRANKLFFQRSGACVLGGARTPLVRHAPPIAVPKGVELGTGPGRKAVARSLLDAQVRAGDYTPYKAGQALHDPSLQAPDAARTPAKAALLDADQAMSANASMHPLARRYVVERIAAQLGVAC